ncbi:DMT family transporter [Anabaena sp. UHCC 0187]|uniref:DMT family transporter n=1 Tax=unclassified Anabaena TaxID=2619674 RepID=UPI001447E6A5|nr:MULTISPECIES: DMT family transporter [unclassified Anabaena]MDP5017432.1 DMT family transporter [Dolichospermum sp.]MTJ10858.1 DMT family transporter [Anabaena sp. UHCC 0204]MTJ11166.1 DMT family transporter [Anabaena sp. UHCC 0187]MTJ52676.1 DMT family transporter [Anabaena sp. UHCC 0253]
MTNVVEKPVDKVALKPGILDLVLLLIAVLLVSLDPIFTRLSEDELGPNATVFNRELIAAVIFLFWQGIVIIWESQYSNSSLSKDSEPITFSTLAIFLIGVMLGEICLVTWALSLTQTTVANSNLLHNLPSVFAVLGGWLFLGQKFDRRFIIGMIVAVGGAISIGIQDLHVSHNHLIGDAWALLSAVVYAGYFLTIEKLRSQFSSLTISLWYCVLSSLLLLPFVLIFENQVFPTSLLGWLNIFSLSILCQVIASVIFIYQLKQFSSGFVSLFMLLQPIMAAILAWIVFQEYLSFVNWIAFFVVLLGIYIAESGDVSKN